MQLSSEQAGQIHALLVEALSIMDSVPYVPTAPTDGLPPFPPPESFSDEPPATDPPKRASRIRKPGSPAYELDGEVYDRLLATPAPQSAREVAEAIHESHAAVTRSLRRLAACGRAKQIGTRRWARYLPLSITGSVVQDAAPCEPDVDDVL